jgi:predicted patatin/cPLA2 family phospholipase
MTKNLISLQLLDIIENIEIGYVNVPYKEIDLVISGGGFCGYYHVGFFYLLKKLIRDDKIEIRNIYSTSAGVLSSVCYLCEISVYDWFNTYYKTKEICDIDIHSSVKKVIRELLPKNAHKICNKKLNIVLSKLNYYKLECEIINEFNSFEHLLDIIDASINIPFILSSKYEGVIIDGSRYYDGGLTNNTPIIYNNDLPQLVLKTHEIDYPITKKFWLNDPYLELLITRGAIESFDFFTDNTNNNNLPIEWLDKNYRKKEIQYYKIDIQYIKYIFPVMMFLYSLK